MNEELATTILSKIFANLDMYWCMGERYHDTECFITIDGSTVITKEELDFLSELARKTAPSGR